MTAIRWSYHSGWLSSGPLLVVAVVAIWATPWLDGARPVSGLLTSIAQVLGTILALLFTISLVVAQMSFARSHRMLQPGIFGPWFRLYLILFVVSVAFPLLMLADSNGWLMINRPWVVLKTTLTLGSICLLFLMPYLAHMSNMMDPQFTIRLAQRQLRSRLSGSQVIGCAGSARPGRISRHRGDHVRCARQFGLQHAGRGLRTPRRNSGRSFVHGTQPRGQRWILRLMNE